MKKDWQIKKLGEVCEFLDSQRKPITANKRKPGKIPYYGATGVLDYVEDYLFDEDLILLGEDGAKWAAGDKSAFIITGKTWVNNHAHVLRPCKQMDFNWIVYFLNFSNLMKFVKGATVPKLNQENARNIEIPVPPLAEQERIVKILDQKFAQIDALKQNAETNLNNAKALFQSELEKAFSNTEWENMRLGDLCEIITGPFGSSIHKSDYVENGIPMINPQNIINNRMIPLAKCLVSNEAAMRLTKYKLKNQDIVIARRGEMGRCAVVTEAEIDWLCGTGSFIIRPNSKKTVSVYLQRYLSSAKTKKELEKQSIGATMSNLNQGILSAIEIPLPPLEEQKRIVAHLDSLSEKVHQLEEIYTKQLADCDELKQSFLQKAFAGEL